MRNLRRSENTRNGKVPHFIERSNGHEIGIDVFVVDISIEENTTTGMNTLCNDNPSRNIANRYPISIF